MKKLLSVLCFVLVMCQAAMAIQTVVTSTNELRIDLVRYDPSPMQPGTTVDLFFEVTNLKSSDISNLEITIVQDYPFTIKSAKTVKFDRLRGGDKAEFQYKLAVNKDSVEGSYELSLQFFSEKLDATTSETFSVVVLKAGSGLETSFKVDSNDASGKIEPGETAGLKFMIRNSDDSSIQDITIKVELSGADVPFAPLGVTTEKKINLIAPGKTGETTFTIIALPDASAGVYKIPVTINYYDGQGNEHDVSDLIGLVIGAVPELSLEIESTELTTKTRTGKLVLKLINYGTTDVKFMKIRLLESDGYRIISSDEEYIGDVDSDDYETAEFRISVKDDSVLQVELDYKDANNKAYEEVKELNVKLYSPSDLGMASSGWLGRIIVVLILVGGYLGYRRWKKRKKK